MSHMLLLVSASRCWPGIGRGGPAHPAVDSAAKRPLTRSACISCFLPFTLPSAQPATQYVPDYVGAGLGLGGEDPLNPQWSLRHSNHPLAPFPGEALKWDSFVYDDGTTCAAACDCCEHNKQLCALTLGPRL